MNPDQITRWQVLYWAALVEGGLAVVACGVGWLIGYPPWRYVQLEFAAVLRGAAAALPMLVCFFILVRWPIGPVKRIKAFVREVVYPLFSKSSAGELALISILAGIGEEFFFRGVLQPLLSDWLGTAAGVALASVSFGLLHFITPTYAILATLAGVYLGILAVMSGNLLDAVIAHALYDFVALVHLTSINAADRVPESHQ